MTFATPLPRVVDEQRHRLGLARGADERALPALEDAGLLERDRRERVAEDRLVIERDAGDDRDRRVDDVRRVEPAAEPDLEHRDVDAARRRSPRIAIAVICSKNVSSSPPAASTLARGLDDRVLARPARRRSMIRSRSVDRCGDVYVATRAPACARERRDHRDRRALAVRAADVDDGAEPAIRRAERDRAARASARGRASCRSAAPRRAARAARRSVIAD